MTDSSKNRPSRRQMPTTAAAGPAAAEALTPAATAILDVAEKLAQTKGYNGFSYADIAVQLGVTKASLHYHFPSKAELGAALIERYKVVFGKALDSIDARTVEPFKKLRLYVGLYDSVMRDDRMCLCGMLAAEYATLPKPMQDGLKSFFEANERARVLLGALEGAMLVARSYGDPDRFRAAAACLLADLRAER